MEALCAAWDALVAGHARLALVVASDALLPGIGTAGEFTTGAGAAAFVLGSLDATAGGNGSGAPARLAGRATRVMAVVDRYRGDAEKATGDVYDGRLFREEVFLPLLTAVGRDLVAATDGAGNGTARGRPHRPGGPSLTPTGSWPRPWPNDWAHHSSPLPSRPPWVIPGPPPPSSGPSTGAPRCHCRV